MLSSKGKIVLTGGPCAGKTTVAQVLERAFATKLVVVPESASLLFKGGFPRWPELPCVMSLQRAIYHVQTQIESAYVAKHPGKLLVLDRGTVDGAAYWPSGAADFFEHMGTTVEAELGRYSKVIYLESAGQAAYEENKARNPSRTETWEEASALDRATRLQWEGHPSFHMIANNTSFSAKISQVLTIVEDCIQAR